jgi:hypothetical protein
MLDSFTKYAGILQTLIGLAGAASPDVASALGTGSGTNGLNVLSGALLSYLGFKGSPGAQASGALGIGGVNALVGVLGMLGIDNVAGIPLNATVVGNLINLAIGVWGLLAGFTGKK